MSGVNKHIIIGRLGKDPELRNLDSGKRVVTFSMATSENYKDAQGNKKELTEWHNIVAWNEKADNLAKYVKKGDLLYIEGKSRTRSWESDGGKKYTTEVIVDQFSFIQPKSNKPPAPGEEYQSAEQQESEPPKDDLPF